MILAPTLSLLSTGTGAALQRPTFSRDFAGEKTLNNGTGPAITFTRASNATFFDANGTLQTAANNVPRFDHDPATGASRGLLIEESRTNSMIRSAEFDDAAWNKSNTTVTTNSATAPDGTMSADTLNSSNSTATMAINNTPQVSYAAGTYTWSMFVKTNGWQWVQLRSAAALSSAYANFDIVNGAVGTASGATTSLVSIGSGWFRIAVTFAAAAATGDWALNLVTATDSARNSSTTGNGVNGVYIWGAQLEAGAFPTSYIPTTNAAATRSADSAVVTPISSFYNQSEGTLFAEATFNAPNNHTTSQLAAEFYNTDANRFRIGRLQPTAVPVLTNTLNNTIDANISGTVAIAQFSAVKIIGTYKIDDVALHVNGSSIGTDSSSTPILATHLRIGAGQVANGFVANGHIRKIAYYPRRLSNALLQQLTT